MTSDFEYDVALSFAGEDREYVEKVANLLRTAGIRVFYDGFEEANLWGRDLYVHLREIYQRKARYTVLFASAHYAHKAWPSHERASAQARALSEAGEYILPARFDDTEIPGLLPTTAYIDLRRKSPEQLAEIIAHKLKPVAPPQASPPAPRQPFSTRRPGDRIDRIMVPFRPPTGINVPPGYQTTLNGRAAEIRREYAVRHADGYVYPVQLSGAKDDLRSFTEEAVTEYGARDIASEIVGENGEVWFQYRGPTAPKLMEDLARKHHLQVVQCGATLVADMDA